MRSNAHTQYGTNAKVSRLAKFDVVSIEDLETSDIERIFALADGFAEQLERGEQITTAAGLIMATLFYEPSTRTRLSFESAMHRLGGAVISSADMQASSAAKGESLADTVRVVSGYADLIVLRHPSDGAAQVAAEYAPVPVINAGDGSREHPTQTLCDLYVLRRKKGHLKGLTVAICGDLKFGRTVHSLIYALARFGANIVAVPYNGMNVPDYVLERIAAESKDGLSTVTMEAFYLTRLQRERMDDKEGAAGTYGHFDVRALKTSRTHEAVVMHPLPRTDELAYELDSDPRAVYFEQAAAGVPARMALIAWLIEKSKAAEVRARSVADLIRFKSEAPPRCANPNCVTRFEGAYLRPKFRLARSADSTILALKCDFCERELKIEYVGHARSHRYYRFDENLQGYVRQWIEEGSLAVFESVKQAEEGGYEPYKRGPQREIMKADEVAHAIESLADQLIAEMPDMTGVSIVGVISRGAILALRLRDLIERKTRIRPPCAALDVYSPAEAVHPIDGTDNFDVEERTIILVDDVINSGWTVQRGMATIWQRGRPP